MRSIALTLVAAAEFAAIASAAPVGEVVGPAVHRNVVIFVADGLRAGSVNAQDAPAMQLLRRRGVYFANSHAVFPTLTMPNAASIATGHYPGDTGVYANTLYTAFRVFSSGNFAKFPTTSTPFLESDSVLGDVEDHFGGSLLGEDSLLAIARAHGYSTAAIGKLGPAAVQDVTQLAPRDRRFSAPQTLIIDDSSGSADGVPLDPELSAALRDAGLPTAPPLRVQPSGDRTIAGVRSANTDQQHYFAEATTRAVLPLLKRRGKPFVLVFWSRDPDGTQHNQGDSLNHLSPGINGPTSLAAVRNADSNLGQILAFVAADADLAATTDVFVTSDHGFATISKHDVDAQRHGTASAAASATYADVVHGFLPPGFLAIELAEFLGEPLFDPDSVVNDAQGKPICQQVTFRAAQLSSLQRQHPALGNGWIGGTGRPRDATDARVIVAANGGSDLIYVPDGDADRMRKVVAFLATRDYIGAIFVDDRAGRVPGALPLSAIGLVGRSMLPRPAIVVSFKTFLLSSSRAVPSGDALQDAAQIADTPLQQGQGMHGSLGRDNTFNFMAAAGPDFKRSYRDVAPAGNADIAPTLARVLRLPLAAHGELAGRVLEEALEGGPIAKTFERCVARSGAAPDGRRTILNYQRVAAHLYLDQAVFGRSAGRPNSGCHAESSRMPLR
jgi:arylsulfatase A-like enzyme